MNVLNIGASFLVKSFRALGHTVFSVGLGCECDLPLAHPLTANRLLAMAKEQGFEPDCAVMVDNGNLPLVLGLETLPFPTCFYAIDSYCNPWHIAFSYGFDVLCLAQQGYMEVFPQDSARGIMEWMPLFAPDALAGAGTDTRDIPVSFVGTLNPKNIPQRLPFFEAFKSRHPIVLRQGDYRPWFSRSHIVLNQTAVQEVNFRCFEAMACGAALLTEKGEHGLEVLFTPGEHILPLYNPGDAPGAAAICEEWLGRPDALAALAKAGQALVWERHMARNRAARIIELLECARADGKYLTRPEDVHRKALFAGAYGMLAAELTQPAFAKHRELFLKAFEQASG